MSPDSKLLQQTASQTVGPFFHIGLFPEHPRPITNVLADERTEGEHLRLEGRVLDGQGESVPDAMIEIWQADARGRYPGPGDQGGARADPHFGGHGRVATDEDGSYAFTTVKPGPVPDAGGRLQAPHLNVVVFARGMLSHAFTRVYFGGEPANGNDPVLASIEGEGRRRTLVAAPVEGSESVFRFDIRLQGDDETVFFDV